MPNQCTLRESVQLFEWFTSCENGSTFMEDDLGPDNQLTSQWVWITSLQPPVRTVLKCYTTAYNQDATFLKRIKVTKHIDLQFCPQKFNARHVCSDHTLQQHLHCHCRQLRKHLATCMSKQHWPCETWALCRSEYQNHGLLGQVGMNISEKLLPPSCALKMDAGDFSKMFVPNHQTMYMVSYLRKQ